MGLALAVTEISAGSDVKDLVAVLATGLVLFTLLVNGTTLRLVIRLGLRLSPVDAALRDRVLALSYAVFGETIRTMTREHEISPSVYERSAPYDNWIAAAKSHSADEAGLTDHPRLAVGLVALANQERALVLEDHGRSARLPLTVQTLLRNAEALVEGARTTGRLGYKRGRDAALSFPVRFKAAYHLYRRFGVCAFSPIGSGTGSRCCSLTRLLIPELAGPHAAGRRRSSAQRVVELTRGFTERLKPDDGSGRHAPPAVS